MEYGRRFTLTAAFGALLISSRKPVSADIKVLTAGESQAGGPKLALTLAGANPKSYG
jgi:hypothetical protein